MRVALVTCAKLPEPDPDEALLVDGLRAAGLEAEMLPWDDGSADPAAFDLCVLRSTWNYYRRPGDFRDWVERAAAATALLNPAPVVLWNMHKGYLRELETQGVAIVPTVWAPRGSSPSFEGILADHGWPEVVVKPAVSAASFRTRRFPAAEAAAAQAFLADLNAEHDAMVQPYLPAFEREGERCLVWIAGKATHAVRKHPRFAGEEEAVSEGSALTAEEEEFVAQVLSHAPPGLLYARVDVVRGEDGRLLLSELELIEPSLFLLQDESALRRFVRAIRAATRAA